MLFLVYASSLPIIKRLKNGHSLFVLDNTRSMACRIFLSQYSVLFTLTQDRNLIKILLTDRFKRRSKMF